MKYFSSRGRTFSLRARLTLLLALAVLVAMGGAAKVVDWRADSEMQQRFDASLLARAQSLASLVEQQDGNVRIEGEDAAARTFPGDADASLYELTCNGRVLAHTTEAPPPLGATTEPNFDDAPARDGRLLRVVAFRFAPAPASPQAGAGPGGGAGSAPAGTGSTSQAAICSLRYALGRGSLDSILDTLDFILLGSLFGACALVMLATPWLVQRGLKPLAGLDRAMAGIGPDKPGGRVPASRTTELAPLAARFNEVLARMDAGLARERQFAAGVAHEFRTRLAELRTLVDVETRYPSGRDTQALLDEIGTIGADLEATVTALLQLTRIESGLEQPRHEDVLLPALLARVAARHLDAAHQRGVSIEINTGTDCSPTVAADPALLEIVLDNLVGNAAAYAPPGSTVAVRCERDGISVVNDAPILQPQDLASFGQRFWRKGERGTGHAGLGLALAGAAARALQMPLDFRLEDHTLHASLRWRG
jgi:signal transduction histidine kinase